MGNPVKSLKSRNRILLEPNRLYRCYPGNQCRWNDHHQQTNNQRSDIKQNNIPNLQVHRDKFHVIGRFVEFKKMGLRLENAYPQSENITQNQADSDQIPGII